MNVDGGRARSDAFVDAGASLELVAIFSGAPWQQVRLGVTLAAAPCAIFRSGPGDGLYARTSVGGTVATTRLPGNWFGTPHRFRIDWTPTGVAYSIDGASVPFEASGAGTSMRPIASDCSADGNTLEADWLHVSPYRPSSIFLSRVTDATATVTWTAATWSAFTGFGNAPSARGAATCSTSCSLGRAMPHKTAVVTAVG